MKITDEMVEDILRQHIEVDATGLAPAVASAFVTGFSEAAAALTAALAEQTQQGVETSIDTMKDAAWDLVRKNGWEATARLSLHQVTGLMAELGMQVYRGDIGCGYPDCGCCADAACEDAINQHQDFRSALVDVPAVESEPYGYVYEHTVRNVALGGMKRCFEFFKKCRSISEDDINEFEITETPVYAHPPRPLSNEGGEIPADLVERCQEVFAWKNTGILSGSRLREQARAIRDGFNGVFDMGEALMQAEEETKREAMRLILALSTRKGSATGTKGTDNG